MTKNKLFNQLYSRLLEIKKHSFIMVALITILAVSCNKDEEILNTAPTISDQTFSASENINDTEVIGTIDASDKDAETVLSFTIITNDNNLFEVEESSGEISLSTGETLDFEASSSHSIKVEVSDGSLKATATIAVEVIDENETPIVADQTFTIPEDIDHTIVIGTVDASDMDMETTLNYQITMNSEDLFEINNSSGEITLVETKNLDFENSSSHTITVEVSDGNLNSSSIITIELTDINEAPVFSEQTLYIDENAADSEIVGDVVAQDQDANSELSYQITANDEDYFVLTTDGQLSLASGKTLDFETDLQYSIIVEVSDGTFISSSDVTINIVNVNEPPVVIDYAFTASEGLNHTGVIGTVEGSDVDLGTTLLYSLNDPSGLFEIDLISGDLSLRSTEYMDFEATTSHMLTAIVSDGSLQDQSTVTITVTNEIDANVTTIAGDGNAGSADGQGVNAQFFQPIDVASDNSGNLYVADFGNHTIRKIDASGNVTTIAGMAGVSGSVDGQGSSARFNGPASVLADNSGNVYVCDGLNHTIRKIDPSGNVTTIAGTPGVSGNTNGTSALATFNGPLGIVKDATGNLYVSDQANHLIRKIDLAGNVTTFAGEGNGGLLDGQGIAARFFFPSGLAIDNADNIYVAEVTNNAIRKIDPAGNVTTIVGGGIASGGFINGPVSTARFSLPSDLSVDSFGNIFVVDRGNKVIRKIDISGTVTTLAGGGFNSMDGQNEFVGFNSPYGIGADATGNLYIAGFASNLIRKIEIK